jgi:hypothetical protein
MEGSAAQRVHLIVVPRQPVTGSRLSILSQNGRHASK